METANPASFRYMNRILSSSSSSSSSSSLDSSRAFSDCNSDRSGEFAPSRRLPVPAAGPQYSDEETAALVADLSSGSLECSRRAAMELRLLAKNDPENRLRIARAGAVPPLVSLLSSADPELLEHAVTAVLNLSLMDENKSAIAASGAIRSLVRALKSPSATTAARENAACALQRLAQVEEHRAAIGRAGAIPPLVALLEGGGTRGKKDAAAALYTLCTGSAENAVRATREGVARPLLELMADPDSGMVDKAAYVLAAVADGGGEEAVKAAVDEGGVPVLVELLESGSRRQKEIACDVLLTICKTAAAHRGPVAREGAIPPLVDLSQTGSSKAKKKAEALIALLRQPRASGSNRQGSGKV